MIFLSASILIAGCRRAETDDKILINKTYISLPQIQRHLEKYNEENCEEIFNYLWPLAKNGNRDARISLVYSFFGVGLTMPGRDVINNEHLGDLLILFIHSIRV